MLTSFFATLKRQHVLILLALVTVLPYAFFLGNAFVTLDDGLLIYRNPGVQELSVRSLIHIFTTFDPELYVPLTLFSYQLNHLVHGLHPLGYHLVNLLLHTGSVLLLFIVIEQLTQKRVAAVVTALLFAIHPLNAEAVLWAAARKDVLAGFFFLLTLWLYLRFRDRGDSRTYILSIVTFALGLLAKVSVILLPLVLLLIDWLQGRHMKDALREKIPFFGLSILFGIVAAFGKQQALSSIGPWETVLLAGKSTMFYLQKILVPDFFSVIYPQQAPVNATAPEFLVPLVLVIVLLGLMLFAARKVRLITFGLTLYFLMLIPNSTNFYKNGFLFFASDRYAYLASIGIFVLGGLAVELLTRRSSRRIAGDGVLLVVLLFLLWKTFSMGSVWKDSEALYRNVLRYYPDSAMAHNNLGDALRKAGKENDAAQEFTEALQIDPSLVAAHVNRAQMYQDQGKINEAVAEYKKATATLDAKERLNVDEVAVYSYLGVALEVAGKQEESLKVFERAATAAPDLAEAQYNLGLQYQKLGRKSEAAAQYEKAVAIDSRAVDARYRLASLYAEQGKLPQALEHLEVVVRLAPGYERAEEHLQNIRHILATQ